MRRLFGLADDGRKTALTPHPEGKKQPFLMEFTSCRGTFTTLTALAQQMVQRMTVSKQEKHTSRPFPTS